MYMNKRVGKNNANKPCWFMSLCFQRRCVFLLGHCKILYFLEYKLINHDDDALCVVKVAFLNLHVIIF